MRSLTRAIAIVTLLGAATAAQADAVMDKILASSAKAPMVGFERTSHIRQGSGADAKNFVRVDRFDPRAAKGKQWTLVSIDGRAPTKDDTDAWQKLITDNPVPGFQRLHTMLAGEPQLKSDSGGRRTYSWANLKPNALPAPGPDFSSKLSAEAVVETVQGQPMITSMRVFAAKPFSIMAVAKMNKFDVSSSYKPGAGGLPFLSAQTSDTDVKAPMGKGGKNFSKISFKPL